jgi:hypothetical protein
MLYFGPTKEREDQRLLFVVFNHLFLDHLAEPVRVEYRRLAGQTDD